MPPPPKQPHQKVEKGTTNDAERYHHLTPIQEKAARYLSSKGKDTSFITDPEDQSKIIDTERDMIDVEQNSLFFFMRRTDRVNDSSEDE